MILIFHRRLISEWKVFEGNNPQPWVNANKTKTGFKEPNLVIRENQLKQATRYELQLRVHFEGYDSVSTSVMKVETGRTPMGGTCEVKYEVFKG